MANIEKGKQEKTNGNGGQQMQPAQQKPELVRQERRSLQARDPFELMRDFMRPELFWRDPFRQMRAMMRELMRDVWEGVPERRERAWRPDFEVRETDDRYFITGDIPGLNAEDIEVAISGDTLQISGKREQQAEKSEGELRTFERAYGSFSRAFELPDDVDVDKIECKLDNGVLDVELPKKPEAKQARRKVEIKSGEAKPRGQIH